MKPLTIIYETDAGEEREVTLQCKWEICPECIGHGRVVHPSISVCTSEDFQNDPDFEESYFSGAYDVLCALCDGSGKVWIVDETDGVNDSEALEAHREQCYQRHLFQQAEEAERRFGC